MRVPRGAGRREATGRVSKAAQVRVFFFWDGNFTVKGGGGHVAEPGRGQNRETQRQGVLKLSERHGGAGRRGDEGEDVSLIDCPTVCVCVCVFLLKTGHG